MLHKRDSDSSETSTLSTHEHFNPKFLEHFQLNENEKLGEGGYGVVVRAIQMKDHQSVAVKFIKKCDIQPDQWITCDDFGRIPLEVFYLARIHLDGVIRFIAYYEDEVFCYLVTELPFLPSNVFQFNLGT